MITRWKMRKRGLPKVAVLVALAAITSQSGVTSAADKAPETSGWDIHVPYSPSSLLTDQSRAALALAESRRGEWKEVEACGDPRHAAPAAAIAMRACEAAAFGRSAFYERLKTRYPTIIKVQTIGGVDTEVFTPMDGIAPANQRRVLINLHGGGFWVGSRTNSKIESMPVSAIGRIKVISVDYRMGPDHEFPAASEDVAAVYRELLKTYRAENIGIYGCSAGGLLTAESVAWFLKVGLPLPGAVGMFCEGAAYWTEGDTRFLESSNPKGPEDNVYFSSTSTSNPLAFPIRSPELMAKFPPSLLISGTRDWALSSVVRTHSILVSRGVDAELHVWEGMGHAFFYEFEVPEALEATNTMVAFFDRHLAR